MDVKMGYTIVTCKKCQAVSAIDNRDAPKLAGYTCPGCETKMGTEEFLRLQAKCAMSCAKVVMDIIECDESFDVKSEFKVDL